MSKVNWFLLATFSILTLLLMVCAAVSIDLCLVSVLHQHSPHFNSMILLCAAISIASVLGIARILTQLDSFLPRPRPLPRGISSTASIVLCLVFAGTEFHAAFGSHSGAGNVFCLGIGCFLTFVALKGLKDELSLKSKAIGKTSSEKSA
jgi:hypothetical protein